MTNAEAKSYLLRVLTDWQEFSRTHVKFAEAIETLLKQEKTADNEAER